eukprot:jgi/Tetstr1/435235/TSEL_024154.t1
MIDFACVSSMTPTWGNDPRWCTPGIAATEAEHNKLVVDRTSSARVQARPTDLTPDSRCGHSQIRWQPLKLQVG